MKTFADLKFKTTKEGPDEISMTRTQAQMYFPNGYGISVIRILDSYGKSLTGFNNENGWEIAVMKGTCEEDATLDYSTPVTSDVERCPTEERVTHFMKKIQKLKPNELSQAKGFIEDLRKL